MRFLILNNYIKRCSLDLAFLKFHVYFQFSDCFRWLFFIKEDLRQVSGTNAAKTTHDVELCVSSNILGQRRITAIQLNIQRLKCSCCLIYNAQNAEIFPSVFFFFSPLIPWKRVFSASVYREMAAEGQCKQ